MSNLLFIRHAETDMAGTFCGHSDPPLNERGYEQLRELVARFSCTPIEAIFSSDLQRARSTADTLILSSEIPVTTRSELREIHFGDWEMLTWSEIEERDSAYAKLWVEQYPELPAPGGEAFLSFQARVLDEVRVLSKRTEKMVAVITHAGVMRVVLRGLCGFDEQNAWEKTKQYCCSFLYVPEEGLGEDRI